MKSDALIRKIYRRSTIDKITKKNKLLGISNQVEVNYFLRTRLVLCFLLIAIPLFLPYGFIYGPILSLVLWFTYEYLEYDMKIRIRESRLDEEAIFFFEVLLMTLTSGRNLENSLTITANNLKSELALEFRKSLKELSVGKTLEEVLKSLKEKIPSSTINNIILNIIQANNFGTSIEDNLRVQLDYLKEKRVLEVKSRISKLPFKVSVISVIFLIPITLLILLTPIILTNQNNNKNDELSSSIK